MGCPLQELLVPNAGLPPTYDWRVGKARVPNSKVSKHGSSTAWHA